MNDPKMKLKFENENRFENDKRHVVVTQSCQLVFKRYPLISDGSDHGFRSDLNPNDGNVIPDQVLTEGCELLRRRIPIVDKILEGKLQVEGV